MRDLKSIHYKILKFKIEHFENFKERKEQRKEIEFLFKNKDIKRLWSFVLPIFTLMYDDTPILIYGMQSSGSGTYFPMVYAGEGIDKHRFAVVRCIYDYVENFVADDVRRFEAYVSATDEKANRLVKFFGMEPIGYRRQAGMDGGDQVIYERLWRK